MNRDEAPQVGQCIALPYRPGVRGVWWVLDVRPAGQGLQLVVSHAAAPWRLVDVELRAWGRAG